MKKIFQKINNLLEQFDNKDEDTQMEYRYYLAKVPGVKIFIKEEIKNVKDIY